MSRTRVSDAKGAKAPVIIRSNLGRADWPGITVVEGADNGGVIHNTSNPQHRVFVALSGCVETWWRADGVARCRRAYPGTISAAPPGPMPNSSWKDPRHYAYVSLPDAFMRSVLTGEEMKRLNAMPVHYCLDEYYHDAGRGVSLVLGLNALLHDSDPANGLQAETLAIQTVHWMATLAGCRPSVDPADGLSRGTLRRVVERIDARLDQPLTIRELATVAGVSPFHFCRMFRRNTGLSPWQFVMRWRVDRAVELLKASRNRSIAAIATSCGFVDQSHLSRVLKNVRGITPGQLIRRGERQHDQQAATSAS